MRSFVLLCVLFITHTILLLLGGEMFCSWMSVCVCAVLNYLIFSAMYVQIPRTLFIYLCICGDVANLNIKHIHTHNFIYHDK